MRFRHVAPCLLGAFAAFGLPLALLAQATTRDTTRTRQDSATQTLPTFTVQAGKREEALQRVPAAITVLDRQTLRDARILGLRQIENYAPNVSVNQLGQVGGTFLTIRGLESNPFIVNRTAVYIDGIPFRSVDNPLLTGASQIEVLRGPQGTLYGANADAGLVIIRTDDPGYRTTREASVAYNAFGNGGTVLASAQQSGRIRGTLAGSLALQYERGDSWVRNTASRVGLPGALDNLQAVGKLRYVTTSGWKLDGVGLLTRLRAPGLYEQEFVPFDRALYDARYAQGNQSARVGRFGLVHDAPKRTREDEGVVGVAATRSLSFGEVTMAASHRVEQSNNAGNDLDLTAQPLTAGAARNDNHFSNLEVRLAAPTDARRGWVLGATVYREQREQVLATLVGPGGFDDFRSAPPQRSTAFDMALFGQITLPVHDQWRLTLGSRVESAWRERVQDAGLLDLGPIGAFQFPRGEGSATFGAFVPKVALDWAPRDNWQVYGSISRGWLPGGFNLEATRANAGSTQAQYGAESLWSGELGAKWRDAGGRVDLAAAVFSTRAGNWLEYNVLVDSTGAATSTNLITSDAAMRTMGAEVELRARPTASLTLTGGAGITDATYTDYTLADGRSFTGNRVKLVPRHTLNTTLTWRPRSGWYLRGELAQRGATMLVPDNDIEQGAVTLLSSQVGYEFRQVTVRAFGTNLTDVRAAAGQAYRHFLFGNDGTFYAPLAAPRVVGLALEWRLAR